MVYLVNKRSTNTHQSNKNLQRILWDPKENIWDSNLSLDIRHDIVYLFMQALDKVIFKDTHELSYGYKPMPLIALRILDALRILNLLIYGAEKTNC